MAQNATAASEVENVAFYSPILQNHYSKTLDIGHNGCTLSAGPVGDILQLSCFHPIHGMVVATPIPQFDGKRFHDPGYVRSYRAIMLNWVRSKTQGFGIRLHGNRNNTRINFINNQHVLVTYSIEEFQVATTLSVGHDGEVTQTTRINSKATTETRLCYTLVLNVSVNRASYGQLTEGGPILIPSSRNALQLFDSGHRWAVGNSNLDAMVEGNLQCNGQSLALDSGLCAKTVLDKPISACFQGSVQIAAGKSCTLLSTFFLHPGNFPSKRAAIPKSISRGSRGHWRLESNEMSLIIKRNLEYILGNCAIPMSSDATCFIADHVALPLGWNRDNYWQIRFLLDIYRSLDKIAYPETAHAYANQIRLSVRGHLNWVFRYAQRPHGYWHRSYLISGVPKDGPVFQQDQQCYPLLEICDFFETFPSESSFISELLQERTIPHILSMLQSHQDPQTGLYATEETPGDDAVEYPYHFSSHVLLWYTITRLSTLIQTLPGPGNPSLSHHHLQALATRIRTATLQHFIAKNPKTNTNMFAYLTDGAGQHTFYHDANDIPTLFIPDWSFIDTSDPTDYGLWISTMNFGLSPLNDGGYYSSGAFGGLGSVHTRGPWPLGYAQEFVYAHLRADEAAVEDAWRRIQGCMFWDGLFPEAVDAATGDCTSKAWFSWPGSMIGSALLRFSLREVVTRTVI